MGSKEDILARLKKHAVDTVAIDGQGDSIPMHFAYAPAAVIHEGKLLHI